MSKGILILSVSIFLMMLTYIFQKKKIYVFLMIVGIGVFFSIIRYGIGADYFSYEFIFQEINIESFYTLFVYNSRYEPLFKLIFALFKSMNLSYPVVAGLISSLIFLAQSYWIWKVSEKPILSLIMYIGMFYFVWTLSAFRQGIVLVSSLFILYYDNNLSTKTKIYLILILSLIHYSALFLLVLLIFNNLKLNKKNIMNILIFSVIVSLFPVHILAVKLNFIPFMSKITAYVQPGIPFLKFGYLVRLCFVGLFVYFYDDIPKYYEHYLKSIIFGFSLYFVLSFSPLVAGRLSIYTYLLVIVVVPSIIDKYTYKKTFQVFIIIFSLLYFNKELNTMYYQSGYYNSDSIPTIFNKEELEFNNNIFYLLERDEISKELDSEFLKELEGIQVKGNSTDNVKFLAWNPFVDGFSIINSDGDIAVDYQIKGRPRLYGDVLVNNFDRNSLSTEIVYSDLTFTGKTKSEMKNEIAEYLLEKSNYENPYEKITELKFSDLPIESQSLINYPDELEMFEVYDFDNPFQYYICKFQYYGYTYFIYLKEDLKPLSNYIFDSYSFFDNSNIIKLSYRNKNIIMNSQGKIIWVEQQP